MIKVQTSKAALLALGVCLWMTSTDALANGTEQLGPPVPPFPPASLMGTNIVGAGTGMFNPPGIINLNVPAGATIKLVVLYWEGLAINPFPGDDTITVNSIPVTGQLIGGPTLFFPGAFSFSYRADITALAFANNWFDVIPAVFTIDGFDFTTENDGAGILVVYEDPMRPQAVIGIRDGNDVAFAGFPGPQLDRTEQQTFLFAPVPFERRAEVVMFVGSVDVNRSSRIRITSGGNVTNIDDLLGNTDGPQWDTVTHDDFPDPAIIVPAGANSMTFEIISGPPGGPLQPASLSWVTASFALVPVGTIIIEKNTVPAGGTGFSFADNIPDGPAAFVLNDGGSRTFLNVPIGSYQVSEDDPSLSPGGYDLTGLVCVDSDLAGTFSSVNASTRTANINLDPGETVTCTFTNTQVAAPPADCRMSASEKGSLLIYPKIELRWEQTGNTTNPEWVLVQDTFIDLTNDYPDNVCVQMYYINGDPENYEYLCGTRGIDCERYHPGWNSVDVGICLTANQPTFWSAATGLPGTGGVSPFSILDPGNPPGRHDPDGSGDRVLRGYLVAWAVDSLGQEIRWNHLKGDAVIVNYADGSAWEYTAYTSKVLNVGHGLVSGTPGELHLDGTEYCPPYGLLLLDFYATDSTAFDKDGRPVYLNTDLTLLPVDVDLRQETEGPVTTKASFTVWNQNEVKLTGMDLCVTCWDQRLFTSYGVPNHFLVDNLQSDKGKAQIDGIRSQLCDEDYDESDYCTQTFGGPAPACDPRDVLSQDAALLGVVAKELEFGREIERSIPKQQYEMDRAGMNLIGMGKENALIQADLLGATPPERPNEPVVKPAGRPVKIVDQRRATVRQAR